MWASVLAGIVVFGIAELLLLPATGLVTGTDAAATIARIIIPLGVAFGIAIPLFSFARRGRK